MGDFLVFYSKGGVFMHVITVAAALAVVALVKHARGRRAGDDRLDRLRLADRLAQACAAVGLLGTVFGMIELCGALSMVEGDIRDLMTLAARGGVIVPVPLAWGLMCAIPLWIASAVARYREPKAIRRDPAKV